MAEPDRDERLAAALRANLKKRKRQERARELSTDNDEPSRRQTDVRHKWQADEGVRHDQQKNDEN